MQIKKPACSSSASDYENQQPHPDNSFDQLEATITFKFNQSLRLNENNNHQDNDEDEEEYLDCEDYEDDHNHKDDDNFTFMYIDDNNSPIPADKASENNRIQPVFPLFDRNLLSTEIKNQLPPVEKVFVESSHRAPSSFASEYDEIEDIAVGPYSPWSKQPAKDNHELNKKSNPTDFSKLWRLRGKVGRSNSDGRYAFIFLKKSDRKMMMSAKPVAKCNAVGGGNTNGVKKGKKNVPVAKCNAVGGGKTNGVKKGKKNVQNGNNLSAHEVYLKKKEQTQDERPRSYLPYRPEIMGFFTNVNGGLSKNVHPY